MDLIERIREAQAEGVGSAKVFNLLDEAAAALRKEQEESQNMKNMALMQAARADAAERELANTLHAVREAPVGTVTGVCAKQGLDWVEVGELTEQQTSSLRGQRVALVPVPHDSEVVR